MTVGAVFYRSMDGLAIGTLALAASTPVRAQTRRPNIVFIMADDLGNADLGYRGSEIQTPNIDRLASQGLRFTSAYTCGPNCQPTRAALISGQYGPRTGVYTVGSIDRFNWQSRPLRPATALPSCSRASRASPARAFGSRNCGPRWIRLW